MMESMKNISLPFFVRKVGEALLNECPMNDCQVYRNVYQLHEKMVDDYKRISEIGGISESTMSAIRGQIYRYNRELLDMYMKNYAVKCFRDEHNGL